MKKIIAFISCLIIFISSLSIFSFGECIAEIEGNTYFVTNYTENENSMNSVTVVSEYLCHIQAEYSYDLPNNLKDICEPLYNFLTLDDYYGLLFLCRIFPDTNLNDWINPLTYVYDYNYDYLSEYYEDPYRGGYYKENKDIYVKLNSNYEILDIVVRDKDSFISVFSNNYFTLNKKDFDVSVTNVGNKTLLVDDLNIIYGDLDGTSPDYSSYDVTPRPTVEPIAKQSATPTPEPTPEPVKVDLTELDKTLEIAKTIKEDSFTKESYDKFASAYKVAAFCKVNLISQEDVDAKTNALKIAIRQLEKKVDVSTIIIICCIVISILEAGFIVFILIYFRKKNKKKINIPPCPKNIKRI